MIRLFRKIRHRLLAEDKYSIYLLYASGEIILVVVGILFALQIDNWNDERKAKVQSEIYAEKLIEDLVANTLEIDRLIALCIQNDTNIKSYFSFFDQGDHELDVLLDSARKVRWQLFRYLPVNYTFTDMQSSGNTNLLNEAQRKSLTALSSRQEFLQIIIDKAITDIRLGAYERNKYLDFDLSKLDFYEVISREQDVNEKVQGLKLQHIILTLVHQLANGMINFGEDIKKESRDCIELLDSQ